MEKSRESINVADAGMVPETVRISIADFRRVLCCEAQGDDNTGGGGWAGRQASGFGAISCAWNWIPICLRKSNGISPPANMNT